MAYIAFAVAFSSGIAGAAYLVVNGHPWFALAILFIVASMSVHSRESGE